MTTIQLKTEIQKSLDKMPDEALNEVLNYIHELQSSKLDRAFVDKFLEQTFIEDKGLLERLAK